MGYKKLWKKLEKHLNKEKEIHKNGYFPTITCDEILHYMKKIEKKK